ncbi:MAG: GNAT family N-acetyltransferase [Pseudomonadota bacterium]
MTMPAMREAEREDVAAIVALLAADALGSQREVPTDPLQPAYLAAFDAIAADPNNGLWVAVSDGTIIGCYQLTFLPGFSRLGSWRAQIEGVRVAASARGKGVGELMVRHAIALAKGRGCKLMQLTTDKRRIDAHRFYGRLGFGATHEGMKLTL